MKETIPSKEYIEYICSLYGDVYDDRIEDCRPPAAGYEHREAGTDWVPGQVAGHKSLGAFRKELEEMGIKLSTSKIKKILVSGGCWTTERSREIGRMFNLLTKPTEDGSNGLSEQEAVKRIAAELEVSLVTVSVNLPYQNVVYKLEKRSKNAVRCLRYKERKAEAARIQRTL